MTDLPKNTLIGDIPASDDIATEINKKTSYVGIFIE